MQSPRPTSALDQGRRGRRPLPCRVDALNTYESHCPALDAQARVTAAFGFSQYISRLSPQL